MSSSYVDDTLNDRALAKLKHFLNSSKTSDKQRATLLRLLIDPLNAIYGPPSMSLLCCGAHDGL